ncbi:hypothetical protein GN958_ATG23654, partial [Phytophthora infestans]
GKFQIKADRVDDLDSGYACGNVTALIKADRVDDLDSSYARSNVTALISALLPLIAISYGYGQPRKRGIDCKAGKFQIKADRGDDLDSGYACGNVTALIKADRVDDLDSGYACSNVTALRFPTAMGKPRERGIDCKAIKADRVDDLDSGYACGNVTALRFPEFGYGRNLVSAHQSQGGQIVCAASAAKAKKTQARRQLSLVVRIELTVSAYSTGIVQKLFHGKFQIKADRVDDLASGYACGNVTALKLFQGKFQIKADRGDDLDSGYACGNVTALKLFQGKFQIKADRVEDLCSGYACSNVTALKLFHGKFQIKADRVDDLDSGYACSNVTALVYDFRRVWDRRQGGQLVGAASAAKAEKRVGATSVVAGKLTVSDYSTGLVQKQSHGKFPIKADRVDDLASGYACGNVTALGKFQIKADRVDDLASGYACGNVTALGKFQIKADRVDDLDFGYACSNVTALGKFQIKADRVDDLDSGYACSHVAALISDLLPLIAISFGYGEARERGIDCKAGKFQIKADRVDDLDSGYACSHVAALKLFQGKFQIKADRGDDLDSGYACSNVTALPRLQGGQVVCAASAAKAEKRVGATSVVAGSKDRANGLRLLHWPRALKLFRKFQIKADRVDDLDSGYACGNVTALVYHCQQISALLPLIAISYGYGQPRERGGDGKAGKFQIKTDHVDDLDFGYACSNVTALEYH